MEIRTGSTVLGAAAILALLSGCGEMPGEERLGAPPEWEIGTELEVLAGSLDSPSELSFDRVAGAARLAGGEIVVVEGLFQSRLTLLTPDGEFIRNIGRNGEGPGEFGWVTSVQIGANDSLFVFDAGQQRLTVFSPDDSTLRIANYRPVEGERLRSVKPFGGESWLGWGLEAPRGGPLDQIMRDTIILELLDANLEQLELVAELPSLMTVSRRIGGGVGLGVVPFSPTAQHATWGSCVFVSTADTSAIQVYSAAGEYLRSFDGPGTPRPISEEHLDVLVQNRLFDVPEDQRPALREATLGSPRPESLPYYARMLTDPWGFLWLQEYSPPVGLGAHWYVITPSGRVVGDLVLPTAFRVFRIDEHGMLGVKTGEYDEEMIVFLPIISRPLDLNEPVPGCHPD